MKLLKECMLGAALLCFSSLAVAADYPDKPIKMIVAYSPGGGNDTLARLMAKYAEQYLDERIVVENHPGAGGQIGFARLAHAKPDGYTIGMLSLPSLQLVEKIRKNVDFNTGSFEPIANIQSDPIILTVNADSGLRSAKDLLKKIKANPGEVNIGGDGPLSNVQLQAAAFDQAFGTKMNFVSYSGSGPTATALLGNQVQAALLTASSAAQFIHSGKIRPLGVFSDKRFPPMKSVPTVNEQFDTDVKSIGTASRGIAAPSGMDQNKVQVLADAFKKLVNDKEFIKKAKGLNILLDYKGPTAYKQLLQTTDQDVGKFVPLLKEQSQ